MMPLQPQHLIAPLAIGFISLALFGELGVCETPKPGANLAEADRAHARGAQAAPQIKDGEPKHVAPTTFSADALSKRYAWLNGEEFKGEEYLRLEARFAEPSGYDRVEVAPDSYAAFLRGLPIRAVRKTVLSYSGQQLASPSAAIVAMDVGARNLQQCADTAIRLHAEYLWTSGRRDRLAYHFTSGDETRWDAWKNGERFQIKGSKVKRVRRAKPNATRAEFRRWLDTVFMYAGTRSLRLDSDSVKPEAIAPGDFFVAPGSPGHAVVVLDIAENADGRRVALLGQGFMPAQELHVIRSGGARVIDRVWFVLPEAGQKLDTPSWQPFSSEQVRRFSLE